MFDYQKQDSAQTLSEGMAEYSAVHLKHLRTRALSPKAQDFFRCHDVVHVLFGCDISLDDELIVKLSSMCGTTAGIGVLQGYKLAESKEVYEDLGIGAILGTVARSLVLVPRTVWRCTRMPRRWRWDDFSEQLDVPLKSLRETFGVRVAH